MRTLMTQRDANALPGTKRTPKFAAYADDYIAHLRSTPDSKRQSTIYKESLSLRLWKDHFGDIRLTRSQRRGSRISWPSANRGALADGR